MKIVRLDIQNVKKIKALHIEPDGSLVKIKGKNHAGKSSALDSIEMALAGGRSIPDAPIRRGAKRAEIRIDLGDYYIVRKFTKNGSTIEVLDRDGNTQARPQQFLTSLIPSLAFDPLAFANMDTAKQAKVLRDGAGLDFTEVDAQRDAAYSNRTRFNRECKDLEAKLKGRTRPEKGAPTNEVSVQSVIEERQTLITAQDNRNALVAARDAKKRGWDQCLGVRKKMAQDLADADERLKRWASETDLAEAACNETEDMQPAIKAIDEMLNGLEESNRQARENASYLETDRAMRLAAGNANKSNDIIDACDERKAEMLAAATMPLEGMGFDGEDGLVLNGVPFEQAAQSEKMEAGVVLALSSDSKVRIILVRDGSNLDTESLERLQETADKYDAQVWVELVADEDDGSGGLFIVDGEAGEDEEEES